MPFADHWTSRPRNGKVRENNSRSPEEVRCRGWGREHPSLSASFSNDEFRGCEESRRMTEDDRELKHSVLEDRFSRCFQCLFQPRSGHSISRGTLSMISQRYHPLLSTPCRDTRPPPRYMYDTNSHPLHMPLHQASLPMCASHHLGDGQAGIGFSLALTNSSDNLDLIRGMLLGNHRHRRQSGGLGGGRAPPVNPGGVGGSRPPD